MSDLVDLEEWLAGLIRSRRGLTRDPALADRARAHVTGNDRLSPIERIEIYREQFWLRHTGSLLEDFPGLSGILGQEDWEKLSEDYLAGLVPRGWSLRDLGKDFPAHVEGSTWLPHHELCIDMARLEWAFVELFDGADVPPLDGKKLASIPEDAWATARIVLSTSIALLAVRYPVAELRRKLKSRGEAAVPIPEREPASLVLYRGADLTLYHSRVSEAAFAVLEELALGTPLVRACERAAARIPSATEEIEEHAGDWFLEWGRKGWVVDVDAG